MNTAAKDVVKDLPSTLGTISSKHLAYVQGDRSMRDSLRPFATLFPVTEEIVADEPAFASYLEHRVPAFLAAAVEEELCKRIRALKPAVVKAHGTQVLRRFPRLFPKQRIGWRLTVATEAAVRILRSRGFEPDTLYSNWGPARERLYGLRVRHTGGDSIVGAFRAASSVWVHEAGELHLNTSNTHAEFSKKLTAVRAEMEALPVVYEPEAFVQIDLGEQARTLFKGRVL